jgi:two-component system OmpR family response regulator
MSYVGKVLLIDDDAIMLRTASRVLTRAGFEVMTHEGAFDATNAISRFRPDVALIDINMPFMSGDRLVALLAKQRTTRTQIVLFSSNDEASLRDLVVSCGAAGFISKSAIGGAFTQIVADFCTKAAKLTTWG